MANAQLCEPYNTLEHQIIETLQAGYEYPKSFSDMQRAVRAVLVMFDVKRRPIPIKLPIPCEACKGTGYFCLDKNTRNTCTECRGTGKCVME